MTQNPHYTKHHPKWYRERMPIFWWVHKRAHFRFIARELTSLPVAFYALVLLLQVRAVAQGPQAHANFLIWLKSPVSIVLHAVAFFMIIFHSITWFNLAPKALVFRLGRKRIPGVVIAASNYVAWLVLSAAIAWIILAT